MAGGATVIQVDGLSMVRGDRTNVRDVSFDVPRGTWLALVGTSGSGKTTILRALAGLEPIAAGHVSVGGCVHRPGALPRGEARRAFHRAVGIVFQFHNLFAHLTALDNVCLAQVHALGRSRAAAERKARELLDGLGVGHRSRAMPHQLSGGEAQRVAIARALAVEPPVFLMDEPTASLDADRRVDLARILRTLVAAGQTLVVASHDEEFVRAADRRLLLHAGELVEGPAAGGPRAGVS
jgi:ABC-type polar amino acid transport system ATPase subunit